jgi:AcrR family transcriptional regulator
MSRGNPEPSSQSRRNAELPPRERILAAARALFYARGIRAVSVDEIAAAADTNKMTLYRHFESKDLLIAEYLRTLAREADVQWNELARAYPGEPLAQLRTWVECIASMMAKSGDRGCALANAAVELPEKDHPARAVIEEHKTHQREQLAALCGAAGFENPEQLADQIFLLLEGARVNLQSVGHEGPGTRVGAMLCSLLSSAPREERA